MFFGAEGRNGRPLYEEKELSSRHLSTKRNSKEISNNKVLNLAGRINDHPSNQIY